MISFFIRLLFLIYLKVFENNQASSIKADDHDIDAEIIELSPNGSVSNNAKSTSEIKAFSIQFTKNEIDLLENHLNNPDWESMEYLIDPRERYENDAGKDFNLRFYTKKIKMNNQRNEENIDQFIKNNQKEYDTLEYRHDYIQWLFPIYTQGLNYKVHALQLHELENLKENEKVKERLLEAFKLMLDFYGMKIKNSNTYEIERSSNYEARFNNLLRRGHNRLRITRILKCLGDFDMEHYQLEWLKFFFREIFITGCLKNLCDSYARFWIHSLKNQTEKKLIIQQILNGVKNSEKNEQASEKDEESAEL